MKKNEKIAKLLRDNGLKATTARVEILKLIEKRDFHPSAEELHRIIRAKNPSISLATVYNALNALSDKGLINKIEIDAGKVRYDDASLRHHHLLIQNENEILDYFDEDLDKEINERLRKALRNYEIKDFRLYAFVEKKS